MKVEKTSLDKVLHIQQNIFDDHRGKFVEVYNEKEFHENGIEANFVQDNYSISKNKVLRGIHGDNETWKLVACPYGKFYVVVVNCDVDSDKFGKWVAYTFEGGDGQQILVPPKHGLAHLAMSDQIIFHYRQSTYYNPKNQFSYKWDDERFDIDWPIEKPILSTRDEEGKYVDE